MRPAAGSGGNRGEAEGRRLLACRHLVQDQEQSLYPDGRAGASCSTHPEETPPAD